MAKKKNELSFEEKVQNALVPEEEQPYQIQDWGTSHIYSLEIV